MIQVMDLTSTGQTVPVEIPAVSLRRDAQNPPNQAIVNQQQLQQVDVTFVS